MDKNCKIVQDLIPLCVEKVASNESIEFVKTHCETCESCKKIYEFSGIDIAKKEKEYDDKMQKIWKNIERQENAKKRKKVIISSICGCLAGILIFLYVSACFHGTVWAIGLDYRPAREELVNYFSQFKFYEPTQTDIDTAAEVLKNYFKENNDGEILLNLIYDEYMTYNANYENNQAKLSSKSVCFTGAVIDTTDILKNLITDASTTKEWEVSYDTKTNLWEVTSSISSAVTLG